MESNRARLNSKSEGEESNNRAEIQRDPLVIPLDDEQEGNVIKPNLPEEACPFNSLSYELIIYIFHFLSPEQVALLASVSRSFKEASDTPYLWRHFLRNIAEDMDDVSINFDTDKNCKSQFMLMRQLANDHHGMATKSFWARLENMPVIHQLNFCVDWNVENWFDFYGRNLVDCLVRKKIVFQDYTFDSAFIENDPFSKIEEDDNDPDGLSDTEPNEENYTSGEETQDEFESDIENGLQSETSTVGANSDCEVSNEEQTKLPFVGLDVKPTIIASRILTLLKCESKDVNFQGQPLGQTIMHLFAPLGNLKVLNQLVDAGGNMGIQDNYRNSSFSLFLHYCFKNNSYDEEHRMFLIKLFLEKNISVTALDILNVLKSNEKNIRGNKVNENLFYAILALAQLNGSLSAMDVTKIKRWFEKKLGAFDEERYKEELSQLGTMMENIELINFQALRLN